MKRAPDELVTMLQDVKGMDVAIAKAAAKALLQSRWIDPTCKPCASARERLAIKTAFAPMVKELRAARGGVIEVTLAAGEGNGSTWLWLQDVSLKETASGVTLDVAFSQVVWTHGILSGLAAGIDLRAAAVDGLPLLRQENKDAPLLLRPIERTTERTLAPQAFVRCPSCGAVELGTWCLAQDGSYRPSVNVVSDGKLMEVCSYCHTWAPLEDWQYAACPPTICTTDRFVDMAKATFDSLGEI